MRRQVLITATLCVGFLLTMGTLESLGSSSGYRSIVLDEGKREQFRWAVSLKRGKGKSGGRRPCIDGSLLSTRPNASGLYEQSSLQVCGVVKSGAPPNVVSLSAGKRDEVTAMGIVVEPRITAVALDLDAIGERMIPLRPLNERQRRNAGVRNLRYAAFSLPGATCLRQIIGYGKTGDELYRGTIRACPEET